MKIFGTIAASCMSGKSGTQIFQPAKGRNVTISRTYTAPTITAHNHLRGAQMANIGAVWQATTAGFKTDLRTYLSRYNSERKPTLEWEIAPNNAYALWVKAIWNWFKSDPEGNDLTVFSIEDMWDKPIARSVKELVELRYLPTVSGWEDLDNPILIVP